jgi:hypothetical protein
MCCGILVVDAIPFTPHPTSYSSSVVLLCHLFLFACPVPSYNPFRAGSSELKSYTDLSAESPTAEALICLQMYQDFVASCRTDMLEFDSKWTYLRFKFGELSYGIVMVMLLCFIFISVALRCRSGCRLSRVVCDVFMMNWK